MKGHRLLRRMDVEAVTFGGEVDVASRPRDRLMALFRGDGTQTHYELMSSRGGRHAVPAMDAADIILDALGWAETDGEPTSSDVDGMCPNCITPWKCNGPHEPTLIVPGGDDDTGYAT